jgi:hypothetical protein
MFDAMTLLRQDYEDLDEPFSLDNPRHLLAWIRCQAYEGAVSSERLRIVVEGLYETPDLLTPSAALEQWAAAAKAEAAFLQVLASTIQAQEAR